MVVCLSMLLPHPAASSPVPAPAASANIIHHGWFLVGFFFISFLL
jgi:hypothetical protein